MTRTAAEAFSMPMREAVRYLAGKVNMPTLKDGEGGNVTIRMEGPAAEEVL